MQMRHVIRTSTNYDLSTDWMPVPDGYEDADETGRLGLIGETVQSSIFTSGFPPTFRLAEGEIVVFNPAQVESVKVEFSDELEDT